MKKLTSLLFLACFSTASPAEDGYFYCVTTLVDGSETNHARYKKSEYSFNASQERWENTNSKLATYIYSNGKFEEFSKIFGNRKGRCDALAKQRYDEKYEEMKAFFGQ